MPTEPPASPSSHTEDPNLPSRSGPESLEQRSVRSFGWAALALGGNRLVVLTATLILARLLTPEDFGVVAAATALLTYFEAGLDAGVGSALIHDQEKGTTRRALVAFTLNALTAATFTTVLLVIAPWVAGFFGVPEDVAIFRAMAFFLLLRGLGQVQDAVLRRDLRFKERTLVGVTRAIVRLVVSVWLAVAGYGAWALVWGLLAGETVGTTVLWVLVRFKPRFVFDLSEARYLLSFGLKTMGNKFLGVFSANVDYLAVGNRLGTAPLGFYSVAYRLPELINEVYYMFSEVAFPAYSKARSRSTATLRSGVMRALTLLTLFGFSAGTGLAVASRDVVHVLFGSKWAPSITPMALISLAVAVAAIGWAVGDLFPASGRPGLLLRINLLIEPFLIVGVVVAAGWGINQVALAHLLFQIVYAVVWLGLANWLVGATTIQSFRAMRPGLWSAAGIVLFALPVRLATDPSAASLLLTVTAGVLGGAASLMLGARETFGELWRLARQLLSRRTPTPDTHAATTEH